MNESSMTDTDERVKELANEYTKACDEKERLFGILQKELEVCRTLMVAAGFPMAKLNLTDSIEFYSDDEISVSGDIFCRGCTDRDGYQIPTKLLYARDRGVVIEEMIAEREAKKAAEEKEAASTIEERERAELARLREKYEGTS